MQRKYWIGGGQGTVTSGLLVLRVLGLSMEKDIAPSTEVWDG